MAQKTIFELDLVEIAKWHRRCSILAIVAFLSWVGVIVLGRNVAGLPGGFEYVVLLFFIGMVICSVVFVVMLQRACGGGWSSMVAYGVLTVFISFLALISIVSNAGTILRLAGANLGFIGASKDEMDKLRPGHCRECGYSREGLELLQECPECERVPLVI